MADDTFSKSAEVELEAKHKADGSWHPCKVSLSSEGGLYVKIECQFSEDTILDVEDALVRLRVRSVPLQGDDCCSIAEGTHVLAACEKNFERLFFDAVVQKATRVRHSKRASCRCIFMIKWLSRQGEDGISSIPSSSIMKLATESIKSHPVVAAFLNSMERSYLSTSSTSATDFDDDDTQNEIDFHGLLKHIEGIGSLTNASKNGFLKDTLLGADHAGSYGQTKLVSKQANKCVQVNRGSSHLRRSGRRRDIQPTIENLMNSAPSSIEKSAKYQSPLSPLAARAVLASLVSKLPQKIESVAREERISVSMLDYSTSVHVSGGSGSHTVNKVETIGRGASGKSLHSRCSNGTLPMEVCKTIEPSIDSGGSLSSSMRDEESILPVVSSRATRSSIKRESANTNGDNKITTSAEDAPIVLVTRSGAYKGKGNLAVKVSEKLQDKKMRSTRSTCSGIKKETEVSDVEDKDRTPDDGAECTSLSSTLRVTRSTARAGTGNLDDRAKKPLRAKAETESAQADYSNSDYDATVSINKRTFPLINAELKLVESGKKQKGINAVEKRQKTTVEDLHGNKDTQSQKKPISSKNQTARFSPRLRSSPRIQSHDKS